MMFKKPFNKENPVNLANLVFSNKLHPINNNSQQNCPRKPLVKTFLLKMLNEPNVKAHFYEIVKKINLTNSSYVTVGKMQGKLLKTKVV